MKATLSLMSRVGLVRLQQGECLHKVQAAVRDIEKRLYVTIPVEENESMPSLQKRLGAVYNAAFTADPHVDTLVLLRETPCPPDAALYFGYADEADAATERGLRHVIIPPAPTGGHCLPDPVTDAEHPLKRYQQACMGGTFDRLHMGQKLLLSSAAHSIEKGGRLFCGIAGDALFKEKALRELIQPFGRRDRVVRHFLQTIRPDVVYDTAELTDGYGPSVTDPVFQAIIVTEETKAGGDKCNAVRAEKGMSQMDVVTIGLISASGELTENLPVSAKLSSTGQRQAKTGVLFHNDRLFCKRTSHKPYVVCITGGIATGKSTVSQVLAKKDGVDMVNADQLGHAAYEIGTESNALIRETFSPLASDIAQPDGSIDRKVLGSLVFGEKNAGNMKKLTDIVWPVLRRMIQQRIEACTSSILVVEAAVAKEAGWEDLFDEVWVCVIPPAVAKERLMKRNSLSSEDAEKRIASQLTGPERLTTAHVLLSNHKDEATLTEAVEHAYTELLPRVGITLSQLDSLAQRWVTLTSASGVPEAQQAYWWREIRDRHATTGRDYHNLNHLDEMFALVDDVRGEMKRPDLVSYAVFFHDTVYDATAKNPENEEKSAELWCAFASKHRGCISEADEATVAKWIRDTANHMKSQAVGDEALFLDIDLAILGQPSARYFEYAEQIGLEYSHVSPADFAKYRPLALSSFLTTNGPYKSEVFQKRFGAQALANVQKEITRLTSKL